MYCIDISGKGHPFVKISLLSFLMRPFFLGLPDCIKEISVVKLCILDLLL